MIALITGINGQDGSYVAELLLSKGYEVHGIVRRESIENSEKLKNIRHILEKIVLHTASLENSVSIYKLFNELSGTSSPTTTRPFSRRAAS